MSYCKIIAMGRLTRDPEMRTISTGTSVCNFGIAFDNGWGDKKRVCFVEVTAWGKTGEFVAKHFRKGGAIVVDGRLEFDQWDDKTTGQKRSKHYITAESVAFTVANKKDEPGPVDDSVPF